LQKSGIYAKPSNLSKGGFIDPHTTWSSSYVKINT
jgi:hypothetical protein